MNDSERAKVADVIETELDSYCPSPFNGAFAVSLMQIIDRLLADRAVPEPVKPWHEYHGNEKVHMPKYPALSRQENHMNDETRNVLADKVADVIQEAAVESSGVEDVWQWPDGWHTPINLAAKEVIALVTAARDAEIVERLLSEGAVDAANDAGNYDSGLGVMHHCGFDAVVAALAAIGLGDGTGGQG